MRHFALTAQKTEKTRKNYTGKLLDKLGFVRPFPVANIQQLTTAE